MKDPMTPTPEQVEAARRLVHDGHFTCGTCDCIERQNNIAEKIAYFLAARDQSVAAEAVKPWHDAVDELRKVLEGEYGTIKMEGDAHLLTLYSLAAGKLAAILSTPPAAAPTEKKLYDCLDYDDEPCGECPTCAKSLEKSERDRLRDAVVSAAMEIKSDFSEGEVKTMSYSIRNTYAKAAALAAHEAKQGEGA